MRLVCSRASFVAIALAAAATAAAPCSRLSAQQVSQDKPAPAGAALIDGVWQLNQSASSTGTDLGGGSGQGGGNAGGSASGGRGGRGGRGGGMSSRGGGGLSPEQLQKLRALIQDVTTMPQRLTVNLTAADVTLTFDSGQVLRYATTGKEEKHDFTNGSVKTKTTFDGAMLTQHIDVGNNIMLVGTWAVSGDQLVATFSRDTGTAARAGAAGRPAAERRWVYDAVK